MRIMAHELSFDEMGAQRTSSLDSMFWIHSVFMWKQRKATQEE